MADQANLPTGPVSGRALARLLGLSSDNAVRTAVRSGRLRRCVLPGGGYDARVAIEEWQANTDPRQQRKVTAATDTAAASDAKRARAKAARPARGKEASAAAPPPEPRGATDLATRLAAHRAARLAAAAPKVDPDGEAGDDGRSIADIRRGMLLVDELEKHHDWHVKRGAYVPKDPVLALAMTLGRRYRDSTLQFVDRYVGAMAVELSVDEHDLRMCLDTHMRLHFERTISSIRDDAVVKGDLDDDELEAEARGHVADEA